MFGFVVWTYQVSSLDVTVVCTEYTEYSVLHTPTHSAACPRSIRLTDSLRALKFNLCSSRAHWPALISAGSRGVSSGDRGASRVSGFVTRCPVGRDTWARRAPVRWGWIVCNGHLVRSDLRRDLKEPIHEGTGGST